MSPIYNIGTTELLLSFSFLLLPIAVLAYFKLGLSKSLLISFARMFVQLSLLGVYLGWIFELNNAWVNCIWVFLMIVVGVLTTAKRNRLKWRMLFLPLFTAELITIFCVNVFFMQLILKLDNTFDARYFIPINGMVLGNMLSISIIGLNTYFRKMSEGIDLYQFLLTNTGKRNLAQRPFIAAAVKQAIVPLLATVSVLGLISLPGMMTGQILGGSDPSIAIEYQVVIMIAIFSACVLNLFLSFFFLNKSAFDAYGNLRKQDLFAKQKKKKK